MLNYADYEMRKKSRDELTTGLVLYGENETPEMQIENLWKIVNRKTGADLADPKPDFAEFSRSDIMYPSMMKPDVKLRWELKNTEWEDSKARHANLKRIVHAQFMDENPDLPLVQILKKTAYGYEIQAEFKKIISNRQPNPRIAQPGTGRTIRDELKRDKIDINEINDKIVQFQSPRSGNAFATMEVDRDANLRMNRKVLTSAENTHTFEYQYDGEGRLSFVLCDGKAVETYRYNLAGQRTFSQVSGTEKQEYQYNNLGQLICAGHTIYTYDSDGYPSEKKEPEGVTTYSYLQTGQLCEVHLPGGLHVRYRFDEDGFRTEKFINSKLIQRYQWADLTTLSTVEDNSGLTRFVYNENDRLTGIIRNGQKLLAATDQLGSIFAVADLSGNSVQEILYDSFGRRIQTSNPQLALALGFAGGLYDSDTGLIHFGYREYDPATGRFISPDPLGYSGGDVDLYGYCLDDPINFTDRTGLFAHGGGFGSFGSGNIGGRATSSLGASRSNVGGNPSGTGSGNPRGHGGVFGAFGSGNIGGKAHSRLGFNDINKNLKSAATKPSKSNKPTAQNAPSVDELGGYAGYTGYSGPSFAEYLGKDFDLKGVGKNFRLENIGTNKKSRKHSTKKNKARYSGIQQARDMEAKAENLGYNTGINNSRGGGESTPAKSSAEHARDMEHTYRAISQKIQDAERARLDKQKAIRHRMTEEVKNRKDRLRRTALRNKKNTKNDLSLWDLGEGALTGGITGAIGFGTYGSVLGPGGTVAGAITGAFYGSAMGMLKTLGYKAFSDQLGVDRKDLETFSGILGSAKPTTHKRDFK